jgi:hypothetical protein
MPNGCARCRSIAALAVVLAALSAAARTGPAFAQGGRTPPGDSIEVVVSGRLGAVARTGAEHSAYRIVASGVTWEADVSADASLLRAAEQLDGKPVVAKGTYVERKDVSANRRILTVRSLDARTDAGRAESIGVVVRGTIRTGIMAIGAETTGVTITAGAVTWELELSGSQLDAADRLNGGKAIVAGSLRRQGGVEIRERPVVRVRSIKPAAP